MAKLSPTLRFSLLLCLLIGLLGALLPQLEQASAQNSGGRVTLIDVDGAIGPATADFMIRSLERASAAGAELVVLQLNTPGGLDNAMRDMISAILAAPVPVATWVAPSGARAASAGTYIAYASHFAAMAPATNIGSSTPVSMGGGQPSFPGRSEESDTGDSRSDMERKVINDAVAYIRGLAELRGRNADWAEQSVREAANLSASEALELGVIDLLAADLDSLLAGLDGRSYYIGERESRLDLGGASIERVAPDWRYSFLSVITNPNIAYILLMIGIYGLILEFYNPGVGVAGVTGIICLLLAGYSLQMLPINYAGLALIVIGVALMIFEVLTPSFGVLGVGGLISFSLGSVMLMDTDLPAYQISMPLIAALAVGTGGLVLLTLGAALKARRARITSGVEAMIGSYAEALEDFEQRGHVRAFSENWTAICDVPVNKGDRLRVDAVEGLVLKVHKLPDKE